MNRRTLAPLSFVLACAALASVPPAAAETSVGVSIGIAQPGMYGRIDVGNVRTQPVLVYPKPVLITPPPYAVVAPAPVYMHVPPGHAKDWKKHCKHYGACATPVYFVQDDWYAAHYAGGQGQGKGQGKGKGHGHKD